MLKSLVALFALVATASARGAFEADDSNFQDAVLGSGKNAFVKFLAPWWGHCKAMKADWDKLGDKYAASNNVMIVDVDCTAEGKGTCGKMGVKGYPTIKYFMGGGKGKAYNGGRDLKSLGSFVASTLDKARCDVLTGENCKPNQQKFITANKDKTKAELDAFILEKKDAFKEARKAHSEVIREFKAKEREFKKTEKKYKMANDILKGLAKHAESTESGEKDEL